VRKRWQALGVGLSTLGLLMAGCGGGSDTNGRIGDRAFVRQANEICAGGNGEAESEILRAYDLPGLKKAAGEGRSITLEETIFAPILIKDAATVLDGLRRLEVASGDEARVDALLGAYESWIDEARAAPRKVVLASDVFNEARALAREYGLAQCEKSPYEVAG
jgi:hypothetical protein